MPQTTEATLFREGFSYLEGFRWHQNKLWFSDVTQQKVYQISADGSQLDVVATADVKISGLGFPKDGNPLVVGMGDNTLRRIQADGQTEIVADLSEHANGANDMWVTPDGRAYISQIGFDLFGGTEEPVSTPIVIVQPDGTVETGGEFLCANGVQLTPDGKTLVVSETFSCRLSAFDVDEAGRLSNQRVIKQYEQPSGIMDGLVLDSENGIWVTVPMRSEIHRITLEGEVTDIVKTATPGGYMVVSCALGGPERRHLYMATRTMTDEIRQGNFTNLLGGDSQIQVAEVSVPGIG